MKKNYTKYLTREDISLTDSKKATRSLMMRTQPVVFDSLLLVPT